MTRDVWKLIQSIRKSDTYLDSDLANDLKRERIEEIVSQMPHPGCCEQSKHIHCMMPREDGADYAPVKGAVPLWHAHFNLKKYEQGSRERIRLLINFCPFCGKDLPKLRAKATPPKHLAVWDDGNYCDTCRERIDNCWCTPLEAAYEPDI